MPTPAHAPPADASDRADESLILTWSERPLAELVEHILTRYHATLERDLAQLLRLAQTPDEPEPSLPAVRRALDALTEDLLEHMAKEERILFPWILRGDGRNAGAPIAVMQQDHRRATALLAHLRECTRGFEVPDDATPTWRELVRTLRRVVADLNDHMLLEDHVLFPRALSGC